MADTQPSYGRVGGHEHRGYEVIRILSSPPDYAPDRLTEEQVGALDGCV
jgi:hypothetical protein